MEKILLDSTSERASSDSIDLRFTSLGHHFRLKWAQGTSLGAYKAKMRFLTS